MIENQSLKFFNSIHDFKMNKGVDDDICQNITCVVANQTSFTALSSTGDVWTWGDSRCCACLGREIQDDRQYITLFPFQKYRSNLSYSPAQVPCLVEDLRHLPTGPIKKISSGGHVSAALTVGNDLYIWGGKLGQPDILSDLTSDPTPVDIEGFDIVDVAIGFDHIIALTLEGRLYTVGFGDCGQLGIRYRQLHQWKEINLSIGLSPHQ